VKKRGKKRWKKIERDKTVERDIKTKEFSKKFVFTFGYELSSVDITMTTFTKSWK
jgi:hypothetical protein